MTNLHDRLATIAGPVSAPTTAQIQDDLARGKRALRRRRTVQQFGASVFAAAAVVAAVSYGTSTAGNPAKPTGGATAPVAQAPSATVPKPATVATRLVAYQGKQPKGFTIDKVPAGWEVQGVSATALTIAPIGISDKIPDSFVGKIAVMLQSSDDHSVPTGTKVTVAGRPGVINKPDGPGNSKNLWVQQRNGIWMQVQIWDARGWTQQNIVEFGAGLHVTKDAEQTRG